LKRNVISYNKFIKLHPFIVVFVDVSATAAVDVWKTSRWTETSGPSNFHTSMTAYCPPQLHLVDSRSDKGSSGCQNVKKNN